MLYEFECAKCKWVVTEVVPYYGSGLMCEACRKAAVLSSPPMYRPEASCAPSLGSMLIVLVFTPV